MMQSKWPYSAFFEIPGKENPMIGAIRSMACLMALSSMAFFAGAAETRAADYVVDNAAPGAADTNSGTEAAPWKTVQRAADVAKPGDTIYVMAGRYDGAVTVKTSGAAGQPITFRSMPVRAASVGGFDLQASYIHVIGFDVTADKPAVAFQISGSNNEITDNSIHDMADGVNGINGKPIGDGATRDYSQASHNRIAYNRIYHSEFGFILGGDDWLVEDNEVNRLFMYADPAKKNVDCDYSRFFGKGCTEQYNYYHGSTRSEIKTAHVDCIQTFMDNGGEAEDLTFQYNTCFDFHQACMVESQPHIGSVKNWTFRGNIYCTNSPTMSGGWGPDICQAVNVTIENNTIWTVRWSAIGLRGKESTGGRILNNILGDSERAVIDGDKDFTPSNPVEEYNLTFKTQALLAKTNINKDPRFVDAAKRDFRLEKGSPAIDAGKGGVTIGALAYPNVWYVDPRHPAAADDPAWGYPGVPLKTLAKAYEVAKPGETIMLRGGIYREGLKPAEGVAIKAMNGEKVIISAADVVEGWQRGGDGTWSAPLAAAPKKFLRDGQPWMDFTYDAAGKKITVKSGGDPRLHLFETVVRDVHDYTPFMRQIDPAIRIVPD
jgi:hypothetical protein